MEDLRREERENEDKKLVIAINSREYDLSNRPFVWFGVLGGFSGISLTILYCVVFVTEKVVEYLGNTANLNVIYDIGFLIIQLVLFAYLSLIIMGVIKYIITGNASPFFDVDISISNGTEDENAE